MRTHNPMKNRAQSGFSLLETMIAIVILSFGILSLAVVFSQGLLFAQATQMDYIAQKKAEEAVESIFTARDTQETSWLQIQNVGQGGIFLDGPQPLYAPGLNNGLVGTAGDDTTHPDVIITGPGPDGILGTADDVVTPLTSMTRTIQIANVVDAAGNIEPNVRQITITMNYPVGRLHRTYTLISYISSFS
jgi:prepilin-type N-terminal cleavage/methylation domain-containing protein